MDFKHYIYEVKSISLSERNGRKPQTLKDAARHNLREIQAENKSSYGTIDSKRSYLNEVLVGPARAIEIVEADNKLFNFAGIDKSKLRKDYQQASEHVFSLKAGEDEQTFFEVTKKLAEQIFGDSLLSFIVHRDQGQPHSHLLISPIQGEVHLGSERINHNGLNELRLQFAQGLESIGFKPPPSSYLTKEKLQEQAATVISYLESIAHPILMDPMWPAILRMINKEPSFLFNFYQLASVQVPKSASQERLRNHSEKIPKPIGFDPPLKLEQYLPCVGIQSTVSPYPIERNEKERPKFVDDLSEETFRIREQDIKTKYYDTETGEFFQPHPSKEPYKKVSDEWVRESLESRARYSNMK